MKINDVLKEDKYIPENELDRIKPYIEDIKKSLYAKNHTFHSHHDWLYHGTDRALGIAVKQPIQDRTKARDTSNFIHNMVNELSKEELGVEIRNKMFLTQSHSAAKQYGSGVYVVIPLGNYQLYYSNKIDDFYSSEILNEKTVTEIFAYTYIDDLIESSTGDIEKHLSRYFDNPQIEEILEDLLDKNEIPLDTGDILMTESYLSTIYNVYEQGDDLSKYFRFIHEGLVNMIRDKSIAIMKRNTGGVRGIDADKLREIFNNHLNNVIGKVLEYAYEHIQDMIKKRYIDTIRTTQNVNDITGTHEVMMDTDEAIFINSDYILSILKYLNE